MKNKQIYTTKRDKALIDILKDHKGKSNIISSSEISSIMEELGFKCKKDYIHNLVRKIRAEYHLPICHINSRGYYWAGSNTEIENAIADLESRKEAIEEHIEILKSFIAEVEIMKKHIQIKDSYTTWKPSIMQRALKLQAYRNGIDGVMMTDAIVIEWWLHNIGYYLTLPFVKKPKIKALNERFKHVDLMVESNTNI